MKKELFEYVVYVHPYEGGPKETIVIAGPATILATGWNDSLNKINAYEAPYDYDQVTIMSKPFDFRDMKHEIAKEMEAIPSVDIKDLPKR